VLVVLSVVYEGSIQAGAEVIVYIIVSCFRRI